MGIVTKKTFLEVMPLVRTAIKDFKAAQKEFPGALFVEDTIELLEELLTYEKQLQESQSEEVPDRLQELLEEIREYKELARMTIDRERIARDLLSLFPIE